MNIKEHVARLHKMIDELAAIHTFRKRPDPTKPFGMHQGKLMARLGSMLPGDRNEIYNTLIEEGYTHASIYRAKKKLDVVLRRGKWIKRSSIRIGTRIITHTDENA